MPPLPCAAPCAHAPRAGRAIHAAWMYCNQRSVAEGLKRAAVPRGEVFLMSMMPQWRMGACPTAPPGHAALTPGGLQATSRPRRRSRRRWRNLAQRSSTSFWCTGQACSRVRSPCTRPAMRGKLPRPLPWLWEADPPGCRCGGAGQPRCHVELCDGGAVTEEPECKRGGGGSWKRCRLETWRALCELQVPATPAPRTVSPSAAAAGRRHPPRCGHQQLGDVAHSGAARRRAATACRQPGALCAPLPTPGLDHPAPK